MSIISLKLLLCSPGRNPCWLPAFYLLATDVLKNIREDVDCNNASRLWFVTSIVRQLKPFF
jgi:hypothetical protein